MKIDEFLQQMQRVTRFKNRLDQEGISGVQRDVILKVYLNDVIPKVNTSMLKKVV